MYALCSDAMLKAITRQARLVDEKVKAHNAAQQNAQPISIAYFFDHLATDEDTAVLVTEEDFIGAHQELVPSVSADELRHYERVRRTFEGAGKKEEKPQLQAQPQASNKGKGKAKAMTAPDEDENMVVRIENIDMNGSSTNGTGSAGASYKGKGKGKAPAANGHGRDNSVEIAEGGFGDAGDDEDLYG
jgi:peroxin-6